MKAFRTFALAALLMLSPAMAVAQGNAVNLVLLRVNDSGTALDYNSDGSSHGRCAGSSEPGCVRVSGDGTITFRLVSARNCSGADKWTLSGVQLGGVNSPAKPGPGSFGGLTPAAASDFDANQSSGWVQTSAAPGGGIKMIDANGSLYTIWYRVRASCPDGKHIWFDPRIENDGTGPGR